MKIARWQRSPELWVKFWFWKRFWSQKKFRLQKPVLAIGTKVLVVGYLVFGS